MPSAPVAGTQRQGCATTQYRSQPTSTGNFRCAAAGLIVVVVNVERPFSALIVWEGDGGRRQPLACEVAPRLPERARAMGKLRSPTQPPATYRNPDSQRCRSSKASQTLSQRRAPDLQGGNEGWLTASRGRNDPTPRGSGTVLPPYAAYRIETRTPYGPSRR